MPPRAPFGGAPGLSISGFCSSTAVASAGMWKLCWTVVVKVKLSIYWLFYISTLRPRAPAKSQRFCNVDT